MHIQPDARGRLPVKWQLTTGGRITRKIDRGCGSATTCGVLWRCTTSWRPACAPWRPWRRSARVASWGAAVGVGGSRVSLATGGIPGPGPEVLAAGGGFVLAGVRGW